MYDMNYAITLPWGIVFWHFGLLARDHFADITEKYSYSLPKLYG